MEAEGTVSTYLEGFIKALKCSEEHPKERLKLVQKLEKIHVNAKSCLGQMVRLGWIFCSKFPVV